MDLARQIERIVPARAWRRSKLSCELYGWLGFQDTHLNLTRRCFKVSPKSKSEFQNAPVDFELEITRSDACLHHNKSYRLIERGARFIAVKCREDGRFANARMISIVEGLCEVSAPNLLIAFRPASFRVRISRKNLPTMELRFRARSRWGMLPEDARQFVLSTKINKSERRGIISGRGG
jgi:hypothetical protein